MGYICIVRIIDDSELFDTHATRVSEWLENL